MEIELDARLDWIRQGGMAFQTEWIYQCGSAWCVVFWKDGNSGCLLMMRSSSETDRGGEGWRLWILRSMCMSSVLKEYCVMS